MGRGEAGNRKQKKEKNNTLNHVTVYAVWLYEKCAEPHEEGKGKTRGADMAL